MIELGTVIYKLVKIICKNKLHIELPWKTKSKYNEYFELIKNNDKIDDNEIAKVLGYSSKRDKSFIRLQQRFENKLSYLLFTIDLEYEESTDLAKQVMSIALNYTQGKMLVHKGHRAAGMYYLNKAANYNRNSVSTEYGLLLNWDLYKYYSSMDLDVKKKSSYYSELQQSLEILQVELKLRSYESELVQMVSKNLNFERLKERSDEIANYCFQVLDKYFSLNIFNTTLMIIIFNYNLQKKYSEIHGFCDRSLDLLKSKNLLNTGATYILDQAYINAYISNKEYENALGYINSHETGTNPGSHRYFTRMNQRFRVLVRLGKYTETCEMVTENLNTKAIKVFPKFYEQWLIKKGYLHLLVELGAIENPTEEFESITNYRFKKLLEKIEIYSKDKTGLNASLRIFEMCYYIARKQYDLVIDRMEPVKLYAYKYLKNDEHLRLRVFLRFIDVCIKQNFNTKAIRRHAKPLHKKLMENEQELHDSIIEAEVIPLEFLWDQILEFLEQNN